MYKGITGILIPVLVIALIGAGFWGYQENQEKNSILIKAENQYQRAFHDLNFHIEQLHDEIGKTLAVNSRKQLSPSLANVWRLAYVAQSDVGQLPLILLPFNKTEEFLAKIADFSYRIAIRDLNSNPLTDQEYKTLTTLYQNSKEIRKELHNVQTKVIDNQLRWMDVEIALSQDDKKQDNTIIDGFKTINKKVEEFPEMDWGPGVGSLQKKEENKGKNLNGSLITSDKAKKIAIDFLNAPSDAKVEVDNVGKGCQYEAFSVTVKGENTVHIDITKKGGYVVWMIKNREIKEKKLTYKMAEDKASTFLEKHGYKSMVSTRVEESGGTLIFDFSLKQGDTYIYPDTVSVKVALDNGEIVGFQSDSYVFNHKERKIQAPKLPVEAAKKRVNPKLKVQSINKAIIENFDNQEVLTYEIIGELNGDYYKIYINAINGDEEEVKKVNKTEIQTKG